MVLSYNFFARTYCLEREIIAVDFMVISGYVLNCIYIFTEKTVSHISAHCLLSALLKSIKINANKGKIRVTSFDKNHSIVE